MLLWDNFSKKGVFTEFETVGRVELGSVRR